MYRINPRYIPDNPQVLPRGMFTHLYPLNEERMKKRVKDIHLYIKDMHTQKLSTALIVIIRGFKEEK